MLDGQSIRGVMHWSENLSEISELKLLFLDQQLIVPVADIRSVARSGALIAATDSGASTAHDQDIEHERLLVFDILFTDGKALAGETWGYVNMKGGGVYLYVRQEDFRFKAIWIPRHSLKYVRIDRPDPVFSPPLSSDSVFPVAESIAATPGTGKLALATDMEELSAMLEQARGEPLSALSQALFELHLLDEEKLYELQAGQSDELRAYIDSRLASSDLSELQLEHARARMVNTPEVDAETFKVEPQALAKISWSVASKYSVVPLGMLAGILYVASPVPMSRELEGRLGVMAGCNLVLVWAAKMQIDDRIAREIHAKVALEANAVRAQGAKNGLPGVDSQDIQLLMASAQNEIKVQGVQILSNAVDERSSVVLLVKRMIMDAHKQKASDIHIETNPGDQLSRVRFRKDGDLEEYLHLPSDLRAALISRIKVMSKLDISERRRPQDGKINFSDFSHIKLELRVAILPTHDNLEDVVMRLLASSKPIPMAQLGFSVRDEELVKRLSQRPYGLILACGPTGSGKTTTLHSLLSEINTKVRKIWTAEDPIEITQPGLRQLQVNPKIGVTFASAMRAFLRADPDVIMIGEIRDEETARISIEASLTGHLVLSTLHTNNAAESVVRLLDLGMDPMNFGDSLVGIVAQRLVRALCKHCKVKQPLSGNEFDQLVQDYIEGTSVSAEEGRKRLLQAAQLEPAGEPHLYRAGGCDACSGKGYKGRMGIYEILENSAELKRLIQTRSATSLIFEQAIANGTRSLKQDALEKLFVGTIDIKQAGTVGN